MGVQLLSGGASSRVRRIGAAVATAVTSLAAGVIALAAFASTATAGIVTQPEALSLTTPRLTGAERQAVTVKSLSAVADGSLGLFVTAGFQGAVERYLGQGHLTGALVALVLVPREPGATPAGIADEGGGFTAVRVPVARRIGARIKVGAQTLDLFSPEQVLSVRTPPEAGVVRDGSQITFYLGPAALSQLSEIKLKVFARSPAAGGRRATAANWKAIVSSRPAEGTTLAIDPSQLSYTQLTAPRDALSGIVSAAINPELRSEQDALRKLRATLASYSAVARAISRTRGLPHISRRTLGADITGTSRRVGRLSGEAAALNRLVAQIDALIQARTPPPPPPPPPPQPNVQVVQTDASLAQNMAAQPSLTTSTTVPQGVSEMIDVNDAVRYQQFHGLGAAMTDSSAYVINGMPPADRAALIEDLFGEPGSQSGLAAPPIHLNFLRIGIGATGAMTVNGAYSYDDNPPGGSDPNLDHFALAPDDATSIIPTLQQVLQTNPSLEILANPWSPPGWMKSNGALDNQGDNATLLAQYYRTYANYFVKFIQAYQSAGIPIGAITPQNEPGTASPYPGLNLPESAEASFIAQYLKPTLDQAGLHPEIYGNDLSWDQYSGYASPLAADPGAGPDLAGIAWHCYFGSPTAMSELHQTNSALDQIVDECSPEIRSFGTPEFLISTLRNWASVVAVWSVALEPNGQPIQTPNSCGGCRGLVSIDPSTGAVTYRTEYYQFGQVSSFVQPGAWRIDSPTFVTYATNASNIETITSGLDDVAFRNPDGSKVLVTYNNSSAPISFAVDSDGNYFSYTLPAGAMTTFVWH